MTARFVLDCSGFGRVLPRLLELEKPSFFPKRESLFTHVTGDRRPIGREEGKVWICIHPEGAWIWLIPFSNGKTSVGVVAEPEFFQRYPAEPEAQLRAILLSEPNTAARLDQMQFVFPPERISGYACAVKKLWGPQFALVGNATEFLNQRVPRLRFMPNMFPAGSGPTYFALDPLPHLKFALGVGEVVVAVI